jgi:hypothetical protein
MYELDKITIIDNFLDSDIAENLETYILGGNFQWTCGRSLIEDNYSAEVLIDPLYDRQLVNLIYTKYLKNPKNSRDQENDYKIIIPFLKKLNIKSKQLTRVKINATLCKETVMRSGWHIDVLQSESGYGMTAIYYINTNNGKTLFKTGDEIKSIKNRIVIFPNNFSHCPEYHTNAPMRAVINFNWLTNP